MKKFLSGFITGLSIIILVGCSSLLNKNRGVVGASFKKNSAAKEEFTRIEREQALTDSQRLTHIGAFAEGTDHALKKVEPTKEIDVAREMNDRVKVLANKPDFNEVKEIITIVDKLTSEILSEQKRGRDALAIKDSEIQDLNVKMKDLVETKAAELDKYLKLAENNALKADQYKATLGEMDSWFGLGAIFYGIKRLFVSILWFVVIFLVLYLILRLAASANPVVGSIFSIFEIGFSWFIKLIQGIAPGAAKFANLVPTRISDGYKETLQKLIDSIELMKDREKAAGGEKAHTIDELLDQVSKSMDTSDKDRIEAIKRELKWK
jgi:hypothetical protein